MQNFIDRQFYEQYAAIAHEKIIMQV